MLPSFENFDTCYFFIMKRSVSSWFTLYTECLCVSNSTTTVIWRYTGSVKVILERVFFQFAVSLLRYLILKMAEKIFISFFRSLIHQAKWQRFFGGVLVFIQGGKMQSELYCSERSCNLIISINKTKTYFL